MKLKDLVDKIMNLIGLTSKGSEMITPIEPRMYLILREDLAYKYIQGGHALAKYALEHPLEFTDWNNEYLICLSVFNGLALKDVASKLIGEQVKFSAFIEPDLESTLPTALCLYDDGENGYRNLLKGLQLATK